MTEPNFDVEAAHKYFAAQCFNSSWALMDKSDRTPEEDDLLVALGHASLWHWTTRPDCTDKNLSVAHWLLGRIYCVVGRPAEAERHAKVSLALAQRPGVPPYFLGCAHEGLARAASVRGDAGAVQDHLQAAKQIAGSLEEKLRNMLLDALATIGVG